MHRGFSQIQSHIQVNGFVKTYHLHTRDTIITHSCQLLYVNNVAQLHARNTLNYQNHCRNKFYWHVTQSQRCKIRDSNCFIFVQMVDFPNSGHIFTMCIQSNGNAQNFKNFSHTVMTINSIVFQVSQLRGHHDMIIVKKLSCLMAYYKVTIYIGC